MSKGTARRTIRIDGELWGEAKDKAEAEGTDLSAVIRSKLRDFLAAEPAPEERTPGEPLGPVNPG